MMIDLPAGRDGFVRLHTFSAKSRMLHHHSELELNLVVSGSATYLVEDRKYLLQRGTLLWLFPAQNHVLLHETRDCEMWILVFRVRLLRRVCCTPFTRPLLHQNGPSNCKPLLEHHTERLASLFEEIAALGEDEAGFNAGLAHALLAAWRAHSADERMIRGADIHPSVEKAAYLMNNETEALSTKELAAEAGLSVSRLRRLFKSETGISLVAYRNKQRLQRFLQLYGRGRRRNMLDAALKAGFGSYPQFHRIFKEQMGYGPAEHRKRS
jgi:methylphosphotriester-DNA--protein-cysteine methyltransferase